MKKIFKIFLGIMTLSLHAQVQVKKVEGNAFLKTDNEVKEITVDTLLPLASEVLLSENAHVQLSSPHYQVDLAPFSHLQISATQLTLKNGIVHLSNAKNFQGTLRTANALIQYKGGDAVIIYQNEQTQLLVMDGQFLFSKGDQSPVVAVNSGQFSSITNEDGQAKDVQMISSSSVAKLQALQLLTSPPRKIAHHLPASAQKMNSKVAVIPLSIARSTDKQGKIIYRNLTPKVRELASLHPQKIKKSLKVDPEVKKSNLILVIHEGRKGMHSLPFKIDSSLPMHKNDVVGPQVVVHKERRGKNLPRRKRLPANQVMAAKDNNSSPRKVATVSEFEKTLTQKYIEKYKKEKEIRGLMQELGSIKEMMK